MTERPERLNLQQTQLTHSTLGPPQCGSEARKKVGPRMKTGITMACYNVLIKLAPMLATKVGLYIR